MLYLPPGVPTSCLWSALPPAPALATELDTLRTRSRRRPRLDPEEVLAACTVVRQLVGVEQLTPNGMLAYGQALGTLRAAEALAKYVMVRPDGSAELELPVDEIEDALERAGLEADRG